MTPKPRYRRTPPPSESSSTDRQPQGGPVVVPVVEFTVHENGIMTVTIDGETYNPSPFSPPWRRGSFPAILDVLTAQFQCPLRVHVREADGSTFTDIITPPRTRHRETPQQERQVPIAPPPSTEAPPAVVLQQITGGGFVPGEDVAVAIIHAHSDADSDGTARALLTADQYTTAHTSEVILLGRVSSTLVIGRPE